MTKQESIALAVENGFKRENIPNANKGIFYKKNGFIILKS